MRRNTRFDHLPIPSSYTRPARLQGRRSKSNQTLTNEQNAAIHAKSLETQAAALATLWKQRRVVQEGSREAVLSADIPVLLQIDDYLEIDRLQTTFGFEVVSEQEDGYVIVLSHDTDLTRFLAKIAAFARAEYGAQTVAAVHQICSEPERLERILSENLFQRWSSVQDDEIYRIEVAVSCDALFRLPAQPEKSTKESEDHYQKRLQEWEQRRNQAYVDYDALKIKREDDIEEFVRLYQGTIHDMIDGENGSFTVHLSINGKGLRDLAISVPYVYEINDLDDIGIPNQGQPGRETIPVFPPITLNAPPEIAPAICIVDSGIQEMHRFLSPAIDQKSSRCFIPEESPTDVADYYPNGGHGTRVAGAALYGPWNIPITGSVDLEFWIQNARVLDRDGRLPVNLFPATYIQRVVEHFSQSARQTRIFNHSITARRPCRTKYMSVWAAAIDAASHEHDVLFIQPVGNLYESSHAPTLGVQQYLMSGRRHPEYLREPGCRLANPAQSLHAITVGSVALDRFYDGVWKSISAGKDYPSAFSRTGLGLWRALKPDVVEYGGDLVCNDTNPPLITRRTPTCPALIRSTAGGGPDIAADQVGTSYSAPKVAHIAAAVAAILPGQSAQLYRALVIQSARWPEWAANRTAYGERLNVLRHIGYGIPSLERATQNDDYRITLISDGIQEVHAREAKVFEITIPPQIRDHAGHRIRIDITLAYTASPRRTRQKIRGYLATWLDWETSGKFETKDQFVSRVLRGTQRTTDMIPWFMGKKDKYGQGTNRNLSTVQKDWAIVDSYELPETFCLAVVGHEGWNNDPASVARFGLAVSFESVDRDIQIFEPIQLIVHQQLGVEIEAQVLQQADEAIKWDTLT